MTGSRCPSLDLLSSPLTSVNPFFTLPLTMGTISSSLSHLMLRRRKALLGVERESSSRRALALGALDLAMCERGLPPPRNACMATAHTVQ